VSNMSVYQRLPEASLTTQVYNIAIQVRYSEHRCRLCIHIPHYPHPNPNPTPTPNPKPNHNYFLGNTGPSE